MWLTLLYFSILQGLFLGTTLLMRRTGNRLGNRFLASLLLLLSLHIGIFLAEGILPKSLTIIAISLVQTFPFLYGPLILGFVYTASATALPASRFAKHFIAGGFALIVAAVIGWQLQSATNYPIPATLQTMLYLFFALQFLHLFGYAIYLSRWLRKALPTLSAGDESSHTSLAWIRLGILGLKVFLGIVVLYFMLLVSGWYYLYNQQITIFFLFIISSFIHVIAFRIINYPLDIHRPIPESKGPSYSYSSLSDDDMAYHAARLEGLMTGDKLYRENDLKLQDVATRLEIPAYWVSQLLGEKYELNFFGFVNQYRIAEAQKMLSDNQCQETILGIAFAVGFNSKTAFNRAFKRNTGQTPSEFRKRFSQKNSTLPEE